MLEIPPEEWIRVEAMVLCMEVVKEPDGPHSLLRLFNTVRTQKHQRTIGAGYLFLSVTNIQRSEDAWIILHRIPDEKLARPIYADSFSVFIRAPRNRRAPFQLTLDVSSLTLKEPGMYRFQFVLGGHIWGEKTLFVEQVDE